MRVKFSNYKKSVIHFLGRAYHWSPTESQEWLDSHRGYIEALWATSNSPRSTAKRIGSVKEGIVDKIADLIQATYAEDEPAMVKILDELSEFEFKELRKYLNELSDVMDYVEYMSHYGETNERSG